MSPSSPDIDVRGSAQFLLGGQMHETIDEGFGKDGGKASCTVPRRSGRDLRGMLRIEYVPLEHHRPRAMSVIGRSTPAHRLLETLCTSSCHLQWRHRCTLPV
ncbi:hypothetical protein L226DRAFT_540936 [Lentinus tigrinus ALCF2SS1-7]|uniref:uncharacterized protein n=1 Tax=Lentinus tigrinus ALCF2SS1-7 TaxID=1328758 RepID=UPI0011663833|nr:hypothetical protein L226DRAFT_540936 [Lentinus tigrinus ALCF2SS1-7]